MRELWERPDDGEHRLCSFCDKAPTGRVFSEPVAELCAIGIRKGNSPRRGAGKETDFAEDLAIVEREDTEAPLLIRSEGGCETGQASREDSVRRRLRHSSWNPRSKMSAVCFEDRAQAFRVLNLPRTQEQARRT